MLPLRQGVGPSVVALPSLPANRPCPWPQLIDYLAHRFPQVSRAEWVRRMQQGEVVDSHGKPVGPDHPFAPSHKFHYYREWPDEPVVNAEAPVVFEDELLLVADKPHFLPVTPKGRYARHTLLARLRDRTGLADLQPVHRIDRETAGLVLFSKRRQDRAAYQRLFAERRVHKTYEAIAALTPAWTWGLGMPLDYASRLEDASHFMQMREVPGSRCATDANAITRITLIETQFGWGRFRLEPLTGRRHQLRVQMAALGLPLRGDRIYPHLQPLDSDDPDDPLRLLACELDFIDPVTGVHRQFQTRLRITFPSHDG